MSENTECYKYFLRSAFEVESLVEAKPPDNFFLLELKVMRKISLFFLSIVCFFSVQSYAQSKPKYMVDSIAFFQVTETQKTPVWCWAAAIAMTLGAQDVRLRQEEIVLTVKGQLSVAGANSYEMTTFLNEWAGVDYKGNFWSVQSDHYDGAPPNIVIKQSLETGRPMIITYRTGPMSEHAVVLYGANYPGDGNRLHSVYYFDPYTGLKGAASGVDFQENTTNSWDVTVSMQ